MPLPLHSGHFAEGCCTLTRALPSQAGQRPALCKPEPLQQAQVARVKDEDGNCVDVAGRGRLDMLHLHKIFQQPTKLLADATEPSEGELDYITTLESSDFDLTLLLPWHEIESCCCLVLRYGDRASEQ